MIVGASLGLVYAPCAGPILAGVIVVSEVRSSCLMSMCFQVFGPDALAGHGFHDGRGPAVLAHVERLHGANFALDLPPLEDILIVLFERGREDVAARPVGDEIEVFGLGRPQHRLD